MTLKEMSQGYLASANAIHDRIVQLRSAAKLEADPDEIIRIQVRIDKLLPLWRENRELAVLTRRYYERSYHKHERYSL